MGSVQNILTYVSVKQALKLIQQNIQNKKLAFRLENNKYYFLNDRTINKLAKGLMDEHAVVQYKDQVVSELHTSSNPSDVEWVEYLISVKVLELIEVETQKDKLNQVVDSLNITTQHNSI